MLNSSNIKDAIKDIVKNYLGLSKLNIDLGNYSTEFTSTNVFEDWQKDDLNENLAERISAQLALGKRVVGFLSWKTSFSGMTCEELKTVVGLYARASGHLRAPLYFYTYKPESGQDLALSLMIKDYLKKDEEINEMVRSRIRDRLVELKSTSMLYSFYSMFTKYNSIRVEGVIKASIGKRSELIKELTEKTSEAVINIVHIFSLDLGKDFIRVDLDLLHVPKNFSLIRSSLVVYSNGVPCPIWLAAGIVKAVKTLENLESKSGYSYSKSTTDRRILWKIKVIGSQQDETHFSKPELEVLRDSGIVLVKNSELLLSQRVEPINDWADTTKLLNLSVEVVSQLRIGSANYKPLQAGMIYPGGVTQKTEASHTYAEVKLVKRDTPLGINPITGQEYHSAILLENMVRQDTPIKTKNNKKIDLNKVPKREFSNFSKKWRENPGTFFITPLKGVKAGTPVKGVKIAVIDFETAVINGQLKPYMLGIYHDDKFVCFKTANPKESDKVCEDGCRYILAILKGYKIFAHNLLKFDLILILPTLFKVLREVSPTHPTDLFEILNNDSNMLCIDIPSHDIKLLDSLRFMPMSLQKVGEAMVGESKTKLPFNIASIKWPNLSDSSLMETLEIYNKQDCVLLHSSLTKFEKIMIEKFRISPFKKSPTITSISYQIFRTLTPNLADFMIAVPPKRFETQIRSAYRGGRCEVIHHQGTTSPDSALQFIDVVSLYPAVAYAFQMPSGYLNDAREYEMSLDVLKMGVYYCEIFCGTGHKGIPFLPLKLSTSTTYPVGEWVGCYTSEEINYARTLGYYKINVLKGHIYTKRTSLFDKYITEMYKWKVDSEKEGNTGQRTIAKLCLNSLLGKFGQKISDIQMSVMETAQLVKVKNRESGFINQKPLDDKYSLATYHGTENVAAKASPQISTFVTAYGRIILHKAMMELTNNGCKVFYVDTDSIAFSSKPDFDLKSFNETVTSWYPRTLENSTLGTFENVYKKESIKQMQIVAPKNYLVKLENGKITVKHAGFNIKNVTDKILLAYNGLNSLKNKDYPDETPRGLTIDKSITRSTKSFSLWDADEKFKSLELAAIDQTKRQFVVNENGEYLKTVPSRVMLFKNSARKIEKFICDNGVLSSDNFHTFPDEKITESEIHPDQL